MKVIHFGYLTVTIFVDLIVFLRNLRLIIGTIGITGKNSPGN